MASMEQIMIGDIVTRAGLDRRALKYLLQQEVLLRRLKLPEAAERTHRTFTLKQAILLSLCMQLVDVGMSVMSAVSATLLAERRWTELTTGVPNLEHLFDGTVTNPWQIVLVNRATYMRIYRERPSRRNELEMREDIDDFYTVDEGKRLTRVDVDRHAARIELSLTHLACVLAGGHGEEDRRQRGRPLTAYHSSIRLA
jgi:hypothetical protein